jgi:hypothetical protein
LDERLRLETLIEKHLSDSRQGLNKQFTLTSLLRQLVYSRLAGGCALSVGREVKMEIPSKFRLTPILPRVSLKEQNRVLELKRYVEAISL